MNAILDESYRPVISPRIATRDRTKRLCWNLPDGSQVVIRHNRKTTWVWQWLSLGRKEMKISDSFADEYSAPMHLRCSRVARVGGPKWAEPTRERS